MFNLFRSTKQGTLQAIYICEAAGQPMISVDSIRALEHQGLEGDRYQTKSGYWDPVEGCQVTMITADEIHRANRKAPTLLDAGQHRRNLVLASISPKALVNQTIQIGEAVFEYHKPRPPCGYLDQLVTKGTAKAMGKYSGCCVKVIKSGVLRVGDKVQLLG